MKSTVELQFSHVDGCLFAGLDGISITSESLSLYPRQLGPLLEWIHLTEQGISLPQLAKEPTSSILNNMITNIHEKFHYWSGNKHAEEVGFIRSSPQILKYEIQLNTFLVRAMTAARRVSGLNSGTARRLVAAMKELESNIHEHSFASESGLMAFRANNGIFEFVVYDEGKGILNGLKECSTYKHVSDEGEAMKIALQEGESRLGRGTGRGFGFRQMFLGIAELYGNLRFRSGDYALLIEGLSPTLAKSTLAQKAHSKGFFVSVACKV